MRLSTPLAAVAMLVCLAARASAHRLDEYLIDTTFSIHPNRIEGELRLTPGVKVAAAILAQIDTDHDGVLSESERQAYAQRVLSEVTLSVDGKPLKPRLASATFPSIEDARDGVGGILLVFDALIPGGGASRTLTYENHYRHDVAVYLVNALVPTDPRLHIVAQRRNPDQSVYHLDYVLCGPPATASGIALRLWLVIDAAAIVFLAAVVWGKRRAGKLNRRA